MSQNYFTVILVSHTEEVEVKGEEGRAASRKGLIDLLERVGEVTCMHRYQFLLQFPTFLSIRTYRHFFPMIYAE